MQIRHYAWVLRRWFWLLLLGAVVCSGITFGISKYILRPSYQASVLLQVNGPLTSNPAASGNDAYNDQAYAVSDSLLITSAGVLQEVTQKIPGVSLSSLEKAVSASPQASSQIIEVRAQANTPLLAAEIANSVVNVFIQQQVERLLAPLKSQDAQFSQDLLATQTNINQAQAQLTMLQKAGASDAEIAHQNAILNTYEANYNSILTQDHQVQYQESQVNNILTVEQLATPPDRPGSPNVSLNTLIAAALGLLLMIVLALLLDWLDTSIQSQEDVSNLAKLEPLGGVPSSQHPLLLANLVNPSVAGDDAVKQAFMVMSAGINTLLGNDHCALLVTGLRTGAGATTTASNLAIALAQSGKRVLLVDANLYRPSLHEIFGCPNKRGLVNHLGDVYRFYDGIVEAWLNMWRTGIPNLWLLPAGTAAVYPEMARCLQELRALKSWLLRKNQNTYYSVLPGTVDIIIFDVSALSEGADAMALATVADRSLLVVQAGKERNDIVSRAGTTLQQLGSPVLGVVVNRQTAKHRPYYYIDSLRKNEEPTGSPSLEGALALSLLKGQFLTPNTPPSLLSINYQNDQNVQALATFDEIAKPTQIIIPSTPPIVPSTPLPRERSRTNQFKINDFNHSSKEKPD